ncbi:MAG TPA: hypothetical protein VK031_08500 [Tissierellaceae bacterium]|nr:hypothetical protein [Tissierellaceae bacterium]
MEIEDRIKQIKDINKKIEYLSDIKRDLSRIEKEGSARHISLRLFNNTINISNPDFVKTISVLTIDYLKRV